MPEASTRSETWRRLVDKHLQATSELRALCDELFRALDPQSVGYIVPEAFSSFMEAQQSPQENNTWRWIYDAQHPTANRREDKADLALRGLLDAWGFEYFEKARPWSLSGQS